MPELTPIERLQPSLLDRLTDDEPHKSVEAREQRVLSMAQLRQCVMRDLAWLLNTEHLSTSHSFEDCPLAQESVINFGIPPLNGGSSSIIDVRKLKSQITDAIRHYEPRLLTDSVNVEVRLSEQEMSHNTLKFEVEADLWAQPIPIHLLLLTEFDLESGKAQVEPMSR